MSQISQLVTIIEKIVDKIYIAQFIVAILGILVNIPHFYILCHSTMRTSSTNSILISIAICDLIVLMVVVHDRIKQFWFPIPDFNCSNAVDYFELSQRIGDLQRDILEQTSFWLGVSLALIRLLIMKLPNSNHLGSSPLFGYVLSMIIFTLSALISSIVYATVKIGYFSDSECPFIPDNLEDTLDIIEFISGVSQIFISLIYPALAVFLVSLIRKSTSTVVHTKSSSVLERHRSAKMILIMTMLYVICSAPCGIMNCLQIVIHGNPVMEAIITYASVFVSLLFDLNAMSHCLLNFAMSSKYRETAKLIIKKRNAGVHLTILAAKPSTSQK